MNRILSLLIIFFCSALLYGEKSYRVLSRGSVRDNSTGLTWTRCALTSGNKPIYDFNCSGEKKEFSWEEALNACENLEYEGRSDWRLPSIRELQSIIEYKHYSDSDECSQVHEKAFPNVVETSQCNNFWVTTQFWSSTLKKSPDICGNRDSWYVDFKYGNSGWAHQYNYSAGCTVSSTVKKYVRCVAGP